METAPTAEAEIEGEPGVCAIELPSHQLHVVSDSKRGIFILHPEFKSQ